MARPTISISLAEEHHQIVGSLQQKLLTAKQPASQSFAIQLALLALPTDVDLVKLARKNLKTDGRRSKK